MSVRDFYKNKTILITGGTGFIGKVLVEKLLRGCEVKTVYLLVRPLQTKSVPERLEKIKENAVSVSHFFISLVL